MVSISGILDTQGATVSPSTHVALQYDIPVIQTGRLVFPIFLFLYQRCFQVIGRICHAPSVVNGMYDSPVPSQCWQRDPISNIEILKYISNLASKN